VIQIQAAHFTLSKEIRVAHPVAPAREVRDLNSRQSADLWHSFKLELESELELVSALESVLVLASESVLASALESE
jgi:hypothetical protein